VLFWGCVAAKPVVGIGRRAGRAGLVVLVSRCGSAGVVRPEITSRACGRIAGAARDVVVHTSWARRRRAGNRMAFPPFSCRPVFFHTARSVAPGRGFPSPARRPPPDQQADLVRDTRKPPPTPIHMEHNRATSI
jgi:hypothetical protein